MTDTNTQALLVGEGEAPARPPLKYVADFGGIAGNLVRYDNPSHPYGLTIYAVAVTPRTAEEWCTAVNNAAAEGALLDAVRGLTCAGCDNRIGCDEWPTQYGDWKQCLSCREVRAAIAGMKEAGK